MNLDLFIPGVAKPEADYLELERLGAKLGIPVPMMYITVQATNPDGSPGEHYEGRSRTFNRNFWNATLLNSSNYVSAATFGSGFLGLKDTGGTVRGIGYIAISSPLNSVTTGLFLCANISIDTAGIVVGTGSTAESFENNTLVTKIAHGNGSGQLSYTASTATGAAYTAGSKLWTMTLARIFNNNSGGTIVVAETGIYAVFTYGLNASSAAFMIERSLLGATVSVLNAGQLTVTYTITLTFPA
jgi:hypothetical protein